MYLVLDNTGGKTHVNRSPCIPPNTERYPTYHVSLHLLRSRVAEIDVVVSVPNIKERMKRYEAIGNFWSERRAGNTQADVEHREAQQTLKAARR